MVRSPCFQLTGRVEIRWTLEFKILHPSDEEVVQNPGGGHVSQESTNTFKGLTWLFQLQPPRKKVAGTC